MEPYPPAGSVALSETVVATVGLPHRSMEDDDYNGMFIPKGTLVIPNTRYTSINSRLYRLTGLRGMTLDERVYANPFKFDPSRFLPKLEGRGEPHPSGPFGFGRR